MKVAFKEYLFNKNILVYDYKDTHCYPFETMFAMANLFGIRVVEGAQLLHHDMIEFVSTQLHQYVPLPFYQGFPASVKKLTKEELLYDQLYHYYVNYGLGDFSEQGHSVFEEKFERAAFKEDVQLKNFVVLSEEDALKELQESVMALMRSTRPLSQSQYDVLLLYIKTYEVEIPADLCFDTAIRLLADTKNFAYAQNLQMSDVLKVVDYINYSVYSNTNIKSLHFRNIDRKFIATLIDYLAEKPINIIDCFERQKIWCGLLHNIHYKPCNDAAKEFVNEMRGSKNKSVYSQMEKLLAEGKPEEASDLLIEMKGAGAFVRNICYIISCCESEDEILSVIDKLPRRNPIVLMQLLLALRNESGCARTFTFVKRNRLKLAFEDSIQVSKRKTDLCGAVLIMLTDKIKQLLAEIYKDYLGNVYIDEKMKNIALPLQESASMGGLGVLPKGSRLKIEQCKKIRAFTYWEKVNDIDLSIIGMHDDGTQVEFSWRTMYQNQSEFITYSGDQVSGFDGGSEYFDVDLQLLKEKHPKINYLVFANNVFSFLPFSQCFCKAGYMLRDVEDSGKVFEPKTVKSSYLINANSTFAYLFALDLKANELIWLNLAMSRFEAVAGRQDVSFLKKYFNTTKILSIYDLFGMMATNVVDNVEEADVVVSDDVAVVSESQKLIRSCDYDKILPLINLK